MNKRSKRDGHYWYRCEQGQAGLCVALEIRTLKALLTRLSAVEKDLQREKNRQEKAAATDTPTFVLESIRQMVGHFETERETLEKFIGQYIKQHKNLKENKAYLKAFRALARWSQGRC